MWNKSYGELQFLQEILRGVIATRRRLFVILRKFFSPMNTKNLRLFIKSNSNNFILFYLE
jgi:hypothetical protein